MLSPFVHSYGRNTVVAVFNSLHPDPLFMDETTWDRVREMQVTVDEVRVLKDHQIYVDSDSRELEEFRTKHQPHREVMTLYLVLTRLCNLNCHYCFEVERHGTKDYAKEVMSTEIALEAIDLFSKEASGNAHEWNYQIVLYGGEPLVNWRVLQTVVEYVSSLREKDELPSNTTVVINTNGVSVNEEKATFLAKHKVAVAVSLDGLEANHNRHRIDKMGKGSFAPAVRGYKILKECGVDVSPSITVGPELANDLLAQYQQLHELLEFGVAGFNPLMGSSGDFVSSDESYARKISQGLIECFKWGRDLGIFEDRMMRKVNSFVELKPHIADCCAYGQQIVVQPDGSISNCHASAEYNFCSVEEYESPKEHPQTEHWIARLPINREDCSQCEAIYICGGGCAHAARMVGGSVDGKDEDFCVHTKDTMEFLIWDLYGKLRVEEAQT